MPSPRLSDLPRGAVGTVLAVSAGDHGAEPSTLNRPGEQVQVLRRGPGGREPIAVQIGETLFALRLVEAQCVEVSVP
jgi:ferrous iron transport protein A